VSADTLLPIPASTTRALPGGVTPADPGAKWISACPAPGAGTAGCSADSPTSDRWANVCPVPSPSILARRGLRWLIEPGGPERVSWPGPMHRLSAPTGQSGQPWAEGFTECCLGLAASEREPERKARCYESTPWSPKRAVAGTLAGYGL
jgi:hypothetical protein